MPWTDTDYQNNALDALWGANRAVGTAASFEVGLLTTDPRVGGVEITGDGYARVPVNNDGSFWQPASNQMKRSNDVAFPISTGEWDTADWEGIWVAGVLVDAAPLSSPIVVADAGVAPVIRLVRRFNDELL